MCISRLAALVAIPLALLPLDPALSRAEVYRVGILNSGGGGAGISEAIVSALASRGYTLGANLVVESRSTQGDPKRFPGLIEELAKIPVNLLVTLSYPAARAAKDRAPTLPIVVIGTGDPVESGLVASLARPGGNMTGISDVAAELAPKRLELLKAAAPGLKKVAMLWNADDLGMTLRYRATAAAAAALGVTVQSLGVREPDDFNEAFAAMDRDRPDGILMVSDALTFLNRKKVFEFAAPRRLPAIYELESWVRAGGLMSYGPDGREIAERAAALVDRVLKGVKPADLPFEQPTRFRLVVNRKTADALGLAIPESFYARADEVIE
jgi:putative tryptophan/tyrosine transport system substrate-binding protein